MSIEEVLRNKLRKKPKFGVRISRNSSGIVTDEGFRGNEEKSGYERRKFHERGENDDRGNRYKGELKKNEEFRRGEKKSGYERRKFYERGDRENGYKGKLKKNVNFGGTESGEERSGDKFYERGKLRSRKDENGFKEDAVFDRENGFKGKMKKRVNFRGRESGEERSGEKFYERGKVKTSRDSSRTRNDENRFKKDVVFDRENGYKGKLKKNVNFKGMESGEERSSEKFHERGKLKNLDSFGRKKRVFANEEGVDENEKSWSGVKISKKKPLFKKGEKKVKDETVEEKTDDERTIWDFGKLKKAKSKNKLSNQSLKDKKEIDGKDDSAEKVREEVVYPSESDMKKPGLEDDAKRLDDRPFKKKKRVMRIDPYDISNKRLDDSIAVDGTYFIFLLLYILRRCCQFYLIINMQIFSFETGKCVL